MRNRTEKNTSVQLDASKIMITSDCFTWCLYHHDDSFEDNVVPGGRREALMVLAMIFTCLATLLTTYSEQ